MNKLQAVLLAIMLSACATDKEKNDASGYIGYLDLGQTKLGISVVADSINIPWDIYARDNEVWFTEQYGTINILDQRTGQKRLVHTIDELYHKKSHGLLGMTLHPDFDKTPWIFVHYTYLIKGEGLEEIIQSRIVRFEYNGQGLVNRTLLLDSIPGKTYHNGSRLEISPGLKLFFSMGDAGDPGSTQQWGNWKGKILRLNLDGSIPTDNPDPNSYVWSMGHRNPQGLVFGRDKLYSSEHGPNNDDEVNLIVAGANYGWPDVQGYCDRPSEKAYCETHGIAEPLIAWTPTVAAAGMAYFSGNQIPEWKHALLLANMKGRALRVLKLSDEGDEVVSEHIYFQKRFGRLRDVSVSPNGKIYLATTNRDWHPRYQPWMYDALPDGGDQIIQLEVIDEIPLGIERIVEDTAALVLPSEQWQFDVDTSELSAGEIVYRQHCLSCHQPNGEGIQDLIPPLSGTDWVTGDKGRLIRTVLMGMSGPVEVNGVVYEQEMPPFAILSDEEVSAVLTYIRNNFGNAANPIIPGEVYEERKSK